MTAVKYNNECWRSEYDQHLAEMWIQSARGYLLGIQYLKIENRNNVFFY